MFGELEAVGYEGRAGRCVVGKRAAIAAELRGARGGGGARALGAGDGGEIYREGRDEVVEEIHLWGSALGGGW